MLLWAFLCLKNEFSSELNVSWIVALRRHQSESIVWRRGCAGIQTRAGAEVRMIERIQSLCTNLEPARLTHLEILREREVRNRVRLIAQAVECGRHIAYSKLRKRHQARRVDRRSIDTKLSALAIAIAETAGNRRQITGEEQIVC